MTGRQIRVRGLVQGVGFRPYVWRLANELGLNGWIRNDGAGVSIAIGGNRLGEFLARLPKEAPPLARIDGIESVDTEVGEQGFAILESIAGDVTTAIGPDAALCPDCIADLCTPHNRRWRYAFTTCTHCGPRFTVSRSIPYDRAQTSLASFPLCAPCAAEYQAPADRRFHAETTCCPACGPQLSLLDAGGAPIAGDPIAESLRRLRAGSIVAIKGLGGFHLACDARNAAAVAELRERKQREEKPFAVMALNAASLVDFAQVGPTEQALLQSSAAPIVLCSKADAELPDVAPGLAWLGAMLPTTPLHLLLWHEAAGQPAGTDWLAAPSDLLLVMTSANPHGEPLVIANDEALERLAGIADAFLVHDREIVVRCDDSVVRAGPALIRRARGYVPVPIALARGGPRVLALGGHLKNTVCVLKDREAFLSQHVGGLDNAAAIGFLEETVGHLLSILDVRPELIAHDLHPDYASTQLALRLATELGVPALAVAHHHAHIAAICAEHQIAEPVLGLAIDGVGLGPDGGLWGGELLRVEGADCQRLGHLKTLALPGGDRAAREPWRMAVSALHGAGMDYRVGGWLKQHYPEREATPLLLMLERQLRSPHTSSLGRWFDAAAGLLGVSDLAHYEGQAAMELEGLAARHGPTAPLPGGYQIVDKGAVLDFTALLTGLLTCQDTALGAAQFHATLAAGLAEWLIDAAHRENLTQIAVGGGCAMNAILMAALRRPLESAGLTLLEARQARPTMAAWPWARPGSHARPARIPSS
ncbi:carbamoyltransferase HypF [Dechloromonas sp. A34]|uniref:carbamoyltransferase HypF n=1 Tax=Dechloromonas sp. A34 TaxID=447588 RepID=UPI0022490C52|nr:carbamoyltransferase HypF [Dechloromonas sp. A34]